MPPDAVSAVAPVAFTLLPAVCVMFPASAVTVRSVAVTSASSIAFASVSVTDCPFAATVAKSFAAFVSTMPPDAVSVVSVVAFTAVPAFCVTSPPFAVTVRFVAHASPSTMPFLSVSVTFLPLASTAPRKSFPSFPSRTSPPPFAYNTAKSPAVTALPVPCEMLPFSAFNHIVLPDSTFPSSWMLSPPIHTAPFGADTSPANLTSVAPDGCHM